MTQPTDPPQLTFDAPAAPAPAPEPTPTPDRIIDYDDACALLKDAGLNPRRLDHPKVQRCFADLSNRVERRALALPASLALYDSVCADLAAGTRVSVSDPDEYRARPNDARPGRKKTRESRPGICETCMRLMEAASEKCPVTKRQVLERLVAEFPKRCPKSMQSTVQRMAYWAEYYFDVTVHRSDAGYWLTRDYEGKYRRLSRPGGKGPDA